VTTFCATGSSDLATSLIGLARVGALWTKPLGADKLADFVCQAYQALKSKAPELLEEGMPLATLGNGSKKGPATMMTGLAVCLVYSASADSSGNRSTASKDDLAALVEAALTVFSDKVEDGFSSQTKRDLMHSFAVEFFVRLDDEKHEGVPVVLMDTLSWSAFDVVKPKEKIEV
jgi:hypothetical protein